ncbi:hypothetical protein JVT61DRAFT_1799 [Boletus reticuloceps]|uniref:Cytochrome b5 heme-binding domain-containing protein n=1 Tax=Boletus reticuloceps TaxID=495285 RepID=A0A8I3ABX7_9AGAM|nr:hypothetical protein JVT61DRAFT_1799 [Boletus reticuloceps]
MEEQNRNCLRDAEAEAGIDVPSIGNPYTPYASQVFPQMTTHIPTPKYLSRHSSRSWPTPHHSNVDISMMMTTRTSRLTSNREETNSNYSSESYAPSRNMFQNADKEGLIAKEALAGEIMENETTEIVQETSARRRWCWLLTWWIPSIFLKWFGRMKHQDVCQAWREKFALNVIIWSMCACAVFNTSPVPRSLHLTPIPTEHVFSTLELASHFYSNSPNNVYTAIRGEVFDLAQVASTHQQVVSIIPTKVILQYSGQDATNLFPVQVSALCNGVSGSVSPWVQLSTANMTDPNAQYHDFRAVTNDSRPNWYLKSMTIMHWNNCVGYMGYTPQEISSMAGSQGRALSTYDSLIYNLTNHVNYSPSGQVHSSWTAASSTFSSTALARTLRKQSIISALIPGHLPHRRHASATCSLSEWWTTETPPSVCSLAFFLSCPS